MPKRFFELSNDVDFPHRWHLAMPTDRAGRKVDDGDFKGALEHMGATGTKFEEV